MKMKYILESRKFKHKVGESLFKVGDYVRQKADKDKYIHQIKATDLKFGGRTYFIVPLDLMKGFIAWRSENSLEPVEDWEVASIKYNL